MGFTEGFLIQTAKDYDISIDIVRDIASKFPNSLYEKLEEIIKERLK